MKNLNYYINKLIGLKYPVLKLENNLAEGEIIRLDFIESQKNKFRIGERMSFLHDGYDCVYIALGRDYFKCIGKWKESQWSCQ